MNIYGFILIGLFAVIHIVLCIKAIRAISNTIVLSPKYKRINIVLCVVVPYFWSVIIVKVIKRMPGSDEVDVKNDSSSYNFYESRKGMVP